MENKNPLFEVEPEKNGLATLRSRISAQIGDILFGGFPVIVIITVLFIIFVIPFVKNGEWTAARDQLDQITQKTKYVNLAIIFIYFWLLTGSYGWTLGKRYADIKVVEVGTFNKIGLKKAFLREGSKIILNSIPFVGYAIVFLNIYLISHTPNRQAVYDKIARTQVITIPRDEKKRKTLKLAALTLTILLFASWGILAWQYFGTTKNKIQLNTEQIKNAEYNLPDSEQGFKLVNGEHEDSSLHIYARILSDVYFADLNKDGLKEGIVVVSVNFGGSGSFRYLTVFENKNGKPVYLTAQQLGDRIGINSISISDGIITADMVTQGPNDASCCPTLNVIKKYELAVNQLIEITDGTADWQIYNNNEYGFRMQYPDQFIVIAEKVPIVGGTRHNIQASFPDVQGEVIARSALPEIGIALPALSFTIFPSVDFNDSSLQEYVKELTNGRNKQDQIVQITSNATYEKIIIGTKQAYRSKYRVYNEYFKTETYVQNAKADIIKFEYSDEVCLYYKETICEEITKNNLADKILSTFRFLE